MKIIISILILIACIAGCIIAQQNIFKGLYALGICGAGWYLLMRLGEQVTKPKNKSI